MATRKYRTIVVGTDGSELADATVTRAARIAAGSRADLIIVCAWKEPGLHAKVMFSDVAPRDSRGGTVLGRKAAKKALKAALRIAVSKGAAVQTALLVDSDAADALIGVADAHDAELIVVGVSPHPGLAERILGTVATDVSKRARCDVLLVRSRPTGDDTDDDPETGEIAVDIPELVTESIMLPRR